MHGVASGLLQSPSRGCPEKAGPRAATAPACPPAGMGTQKGCGQPDTHPHHGPGPLPPAELAGPLPPRAPPRPMGSSEAGARQHPNPAMEAGGPAPIWRAGPAELERSPPSRPFLPSPLPPAGRPYSRTPRRAPAHPATLSRPAIRSARGGHVTRGLLSEPMAGRAPLAPRARARAEGAPAAPRCCEGLGCFWGLGFVLLIKELCRIRFNHVSACSHRFCLNTVQPTKPGKKISSVKPQ